MTPNDDNNNKGSMPPTRTQDIAEDVMWAFRSSTEWVLTESEIIEKVDEDEDKISKVVDHLNSVGEIQCRELESDTVYWPKP